GFPCGQVRRLLQRPGGAGAACSTFPFSRVSQIRFTGFTSGQVLSLGFVKSQQVLEVGGYPAPVNIIPIDDAGPIWALSKVEAVRIALVPFGKADYLGEIVDVTDETGAMLGRTGRRAVGISRKLLFHMLVGPLDVRPAEMHLQLPVPAI